MIHRLRCTAITLAIALSSASTGWAQAIQITHIQNTPDNEVRISFKIENQLNEHICLDERVLDEMGDPAPNILEISDVNGNKLDSPGSRGLRFYENMHVDFRRIESGDVLHSSLNVSYFYVADDQQEILKRGNMYQFRLVMYFKIGCLENENALDYPYDIDRVGSYLPLSESWTKGESIISDHFFFDY